MYIKKSKNKIIWKKMKNNTEKKLTFLRILESCLLSKNSLGKTTYPIGTIHHIRGLALGILGLLRLWLSEKQIVPYFSPFFTTVHSLRGHKNNKKLNRWIMYELYFSFFSLCCCAESLTIGMSFTCILYLTN